MYETSLEWSAKCRQFTAMGMSEMEGNEMGERDTGEELNSWDLVWGRYKSLSYVLIKSMR